MLRILQRKFRLKLHNEIDIIYLFVAYIPQNDFTDNRNMILLQCKINHRNITQSDFQAFTHGVRCLFIDLYLLIQS